MQVKCKIKCTYAIELTEDEAKQFRLTLVNCIGTVTAPQDRELLNQLHAILQGSLEGPK